MKQPNANNTLTNIINDNERHGWSERNESDMVIKIRTSKRVTEYRKVEHACGAWVGLDDIRVFEITTKDEPLWRNGNRKNANNQ